MTFSEMALKGMKILVVDDEEVLRECMKEALELMGAVVTEAANGQQALDLASANTFDVVITDVRMPILGGMELLDELRKRDPIKPLCILVTGYTDISNSEAYDRGASAIFAKPFDVGALAEVAVRLLGQPNLRWSRKFTRFNKRFDVEVKFSNLANPGPNLPTLKMRAFNIGEGGMFLASDEDLPKGLTTVSFVIQFAEKQKKISGDGIVRWVRDQSGAEGLRGFGIEFTRLDSNSLQVLGDFLKDETTQP